MESYNSHTVYSSSSSASANSSFSRDKYNKAAMPSFLSSLHSVRKPPVMAPKPMLKKPIAPLPPTPPKVYKVDSTNFKQVVQKLTTIPEFQTSAARRLQDVAPPPLNISSAPKLLRSLSSINENAPPQALPSPLLAIFRDLMDDSLFDDDNSIVPSKGFGEGLIVSPLGFSLTPNFTSFLNETLLDNCGTAKSTRSSDSWAALLSPLGLNLSPTISKNVVTKAFSKSSDCFGAPSPLGFGLSPSSAAWCSLALASPGALSPSFMGQTTVL